MKTRTIVVIRDSKGQTIGGGATEYSELDRREQLIEALSSAIRHGNNYKNLTKSFTVFVRAEEIGEDQNS